MSKVAELSDALKVFILGSPRSGTSITYLAMREVVRLKGRGESHVVPIFLRMQEQFGDYVEEFQRDPGVLAAHLDSRTLRACLANYIRRFYFRMYGESFVDKTPGAETIRGFAFIREIFPDARVLLLQRNGIEVINSYRSKFGTPFQDACTSWVHVVTASAALLAEHRDVLLVDQFDLTNAPLVAAGRIAAHIARPDVRDQLAAFFHDRRIEQHSTHDWTRRLTLADVDWSEEQKAVFRSICGEQMERLGYAM